MIDLYPKHYGEHGPKLKRPTLPEGEGDIALIAQVIVLLIATASLARPRSLCWWGDEEVVEVEIAMRAVAKANPKVLKIEDRRNGPTSAIELMRLHDFEQIATLYTKRRANP